MKFIPKTADEIAIEKARFGPWPKGAYDFEVASADDATSKKGSEMIVLELMVYDRQGARRTLKDWLVETMPIKLKNACEAVGLEGAYDNGNVSSFDFVGRTGKLMLGIERQDGYEDRNKVTGYVPAAPVPASAPRAPAAGSQTLRAAARQKAPAGDIDDEIPF